MITGGIDIQAASIIGLTSIIQGYLWSDLGTVSYTHLDVYKRQVLTRA